MNEKRNWKIYFEWIEGKEYPELATQYGLAIETIKEICKEKIPAKVKQTDWQRANSYRKYREWQRKLLQERKQLTT